MCCFMFVYHSQAFILHSHHGPSKDKALIEKFECRESPSVTSRCGACPIKSNLKTSCSERHDLRGEFRECIFLIRGLVPKRYTVYRYTLWSGVPANSQESSCFL